MRDSLAGAEAAVSYTTSLAKGQALVQETLELLRFWEPGMGADELADQALEQNLLAKFSEVRTRDVVKRIFRKRYLVDEARPARLMKGLMLRGASSQVLIQLMLLYTARFHLILHDFISSVYWPKYQAGATHITRDDAEAFLDDAYLAGRIEQRWSESMRARVARYLYGCLVDFGMATNASGRRKAIKSFYALPETVVFLAHELHFQGLSDDQIQHHPDWKLFGFTAEDVYRQLDLAAGLGHFIVQYSGELLRVSWTYQNMEECLDAIA